MSALRPWMKSLLYFAGGYNVLAGLGMICLYHEGFKLFGIAKPKMNLPIQLVGLFVLLFGVGYVLVARHPRENRNLLLLGFLSKLLGSAFGLVYVAKGALPPVFLPVLLFSDIGYLPPFLLILRHLDAASADGGTNTTLAREPRREKQPAPASRQPAG